jgi:hypothetical protein
VSAQENKTAAYGIFPMDIRLDEVVASLNSAGFGSEDICVFLPPAHPIADGVRNMKAAASDLSAEAGLARMISWLSTFGGVVIPGVGFFVGSREYLHALTKTELTVGGDGGLLTSLGIAHEAAARYAARVCRDASLVFVSCDGSAQSEWAREILRRLRAEEVRLLGEFGNGERESEEAGTPVVSQQQ